jgi:Metalloenzyme superfamily
VAAFTSWDVFPFIFNTDRNHLVVNSGYENRKEEGSKQQKLINEIQTGSVNEKTATRFDQLTFLTAREYIQKHKPRVVFIGLGETDETAHDGRYDLYLEKANQADKMIAGLWHWIQTTPGYKDNSTLIITTDHGRGSRTAKWTSHGNFVKGSSQTWLGIIGPHISRFGEMKGSDQLYQQQLAQTIALSLGENFPESRAPAIHLR